MLLRTPFLQLLQQLQQTLEKLSDQEYITPVSRLANATIGDHLRHIIEFLLELNKGYDSGLVNYDQRKRDHSIATDRRVALQKLQELRSLIYLPDRDLFLLASHGAADEDPIQIRTNYFREMIYNIEHMVHHMALLRVAIDAITKLVLPEGFGVAASTIKFRQACAQ